MFCSTAQADKDLWTSSPKNTMHLLGVETPEEALILPGQPAVVEANDRTSRIYNELCEAHCSLAMDSSRSAISSLSTSPGDWL